MIGNMNIIERENPIIVEAKTCGCNTASNNNNNKNSQKKSITYHFIESAHILCLDKNELILAQIQACERLLKYSKEYDVNYFLDNII